MAQSEPSGPSGSGGPSGPSGPSGRSAIRQFRTKWTKWPPSHVIFSNQVDQVAAQPFDDFEQVGRNFQVEYNSGASGPSGRHIFQLRTPYTLWFGVDDGDYADGGRFGLAGN